MSRRNVTTARLEGVVRILLGSGQVMAATVGLILLLRTGVNVLSVVAVGIALSLTFISIVLFRKSRP